MDHKVSKDMISSGMIPSGEKTQADLGRIQYGSAPSPSALMDAYRSIYEHHQKDKDGNTIPHQEDLNEGKIPAGLQAYLDKKKGKKEDKKEVKEENVDESILGMAARGANMARRASLAAGKAAARGTSALRAADARVQAAGGLGKMAAKTKIGQSAIAAGKGIKKTVGAPGFKGALAGGAIGGAVGAGLMSGGKKKENDRGIVRPKNVKGFSNYDLNFDYTPEGDVISEDLFDALKSALIEEGCDEKNVMKIMASVTPDYFDEIIQEENIDEAVVTGSILAGLAAKKLLAGALVKKGAALAAKSIAKKGLVGAAKAGSKAFGAGLKKGAMTAGKTAGKSITTSGGKVVGGAGKVKQATGLAGAGQRVGQGARALGAAAKNNPMMTGLTGIQAYQMSPLGAPKMPKMPTQQRAAVSGRRTAGGLRMDLDLFDVVKGKLLDEGLTEKECTEVMTTLTLDEIQEGLGKMKVFPTAALLGGAAAATQQIASRMGKKSGEESIKPKKSGLIKKIKDRTDATNKAIEQM